MSRKVDTRTYAQKRRESYRDAARERLRAAQYIRRMLEIAEKLDTCEPSEVAALRLKVDIYTRLLAKCLPDLKATEITGTLTHRRVEEMSDEELYAIAAQGRDGDPEAEEGERSTH